MHAILYAKNETKFIDYGLGVIIASVGEVTTQRNGEYTIYMEIPQEVLDTYRYDQLIEVGMFLKAKAGTRRSLQTFEINRVVKADDGALRIWGEHVLLARLNADNIRPSVSVKGGADVALQALSDNLVSGKGFDAQSDIDTSNTANWAVNHFENAKEVLAGKSGSILDIWGGEYEFDNNLIYLHKRLGRKAPTALIYGRNITSIKQDERIDSTYTSVYPYAVYQDDKQKEHLVSIDNFVIDSGHVDKYQQRKIKTIDLSEKFKEREVPTKEKLIKLAEAYIKNNSIGVPTTKLEIEYQDLSKLAEFEEFGFIEEIDVCDVLPVYYPKIGVTDQDARVTEVVYDFINDQNKSIKIGTIGRSTSYTLSKTIQEQLDGLDSKQKAIASQLPYLIDGRGNRVWRTTPDPNMEHKVGDVWFDKNGKYMIIKIWDGQKWAIELDEESYQKMIDEKLKDLEVQIQSANNRSNEISAKADQSLQRFDDELSSMRTKLESLGLPQESINEALDSFRRQLDDVARKTDATVEMIGNDGVTRYNKNILKGDFKRTVDYDTGRTSIIANDGGFKKGQTYTISFDAVCKLILQTELTLDFVAPTINRGVSFRLIPSRKRLQTHTGSTTNRLWKKTIHQDRYTANITSDWYKTINKVIDHKGVTKETIALAYRDYVEANLTADRQFEWSSGYDLLIQSSL